MERQSDSANKPAALELERVAAFFQPILAMDSRRVIGYEVLGRYRTPQGVVSLGPFFLDPSASLDEQMRIDRHIRELAIAAIAGTPGDAKLFINLKPSWIYAMYRDTGELLTLQLLRKYGVDPGRIVVEITEEAFRGSMEALREVIDVYREAGCLIAVDDAGTGFSSAERIAELQPNLLKVDLHLMKKSASHNGYLAVIHSFSALAEQLGASLLIEGVEKERDLQRAIAIGARYVQGYLFSPAAPAFGQPDDYSALLEKALCDYREHRIAAERAWKAEGEALTVMLAEETPAVADDPDALINRLLPRLADGCLRVYLCGGDGIQLSANYRRKEDGWACEPEYRGADWSWRPYFIPNLLSMENQREAVISRTYSDLETRSWIRTLSASVGRSRILFVDMQVPPEIED